MIRITTKEAIFKRIEEKESALRRIKSAAFPKNPQLEISHMRRQENANAFLREIQDVWFYTSFEGTTYRLLSKDLFAIYMNDADVVAIDYDGTYCKMATVWKYPYNPVCLIYIASIRNL